MKERKIIAIGNQKGGVGKTTTALNLGAALVRKGKKVLLVDLDQQGNLSNYLGYRSIDDSNVVTIFDLMKENVENCEIKTFEKSIIHNKSENIDYIPADVSLAGAEALLLSAMSRERILSNILNDERLDYDYIIIDCLPGIGILFINAIAAANSLIIPVQAQPFALDGLTQIIKIYTQVQKLINPDLRLTGILPTMVDNTVISRSIVETLKDTYLDDVFDTTISKRVEAAESTYKSQSLITKKNSIIGSEYITVADELIRRLEKKEK